MVWSRDALPGERAHHWGHTRDAITGVRIEIHPFVRGEANDALVVVDKRRSWVIVRPEPTASRVMTTALEINSVSQKLALS